MEQHIARGNALVVDDSPIVQMVHKLFLEHEGYQVDIVDTAEKALELLENHYQLVLMDVNLPGINGIEATQEIRRRERGIVHTPIIGITAAIAEKEKAQQCLSAGMDVVVGKPLTARQLTELLQRWI